MKIAICVHNLANGGAERVAVLWAKGFVMRGYETHIIIAEKDTVVDYEVPEQVTLHLVYSEGISIYRYSSKVLQLRRLMKRIRPDVAIAVMRPWNHWLLMATIGLKIPIINTEHNSFERPKSDPMPLSLKIDKFFLNRLFKGVTLLTSADKEIWGKKRNNVFVLPNPLAFTPIKNETTRKKVLMAVGRLNAWRCKGFDNLIVAWGMVAPKYPEWKLCIAGNGRKEDIEVLQKMILFNKVQNNTELIGFRHDIKELYKQSEIFILSSRYEGFGLVLIEAMSQGCACIACDYKGRQKEIFGNDETGLTCPTENVNALAKSIEKLIENTSFRERIRLNAIERSKYFNISNTIDRWEYIFTSLNIIKK